jgi:hypothetical protein
MLIIVLVGFTACSQGPDSRSIRTSLSGSGLGGTTILADDTPPPNVCSAACSGGAFGAPKCSCRISVPWERFSSDWCLGPVAQGIEQQPSKLKVAGSNPAGVANLLKSARSAHFICIYPVAKICRQRLPPTARSSRPNRTSRSGLSTCPWARSSTSAIRHGR